ncbi:MAG TPA: hypothetical protein PKY59_04545 [Pyrinomonadaceae bacterium]|nr:hypothetical protein [Pyrinomonadaceae bacterium]
MGLFSIAIISVLSASVIAYLWAYQFYSPNKTVEDALPEIVSLDEKYKSEYLDAQNLQNRSKESNKPKFNLKDINKTSIEPGTTVKICRNGDGQKIPCNPLLKEFPNGYFEQQKEQKKHFEEVQEFEKIQEKVLDRENIVYFFTEGALIKTKHEEERTKILENYRATQSYNSFIFTFFLSFTALVASLWLIVGRR